MVILIVVTLVQRSVGFGRGVLFCRMLTPDTLGQWEMAYSFLLLAAPLAVLGIPGTFGRYLEHYRQRGHLRTFLRRTATWTLVWSLAAIGVILWFAPYFSFLLFRSYEHATLVRGIAICLVTIIYHHTLTSLLTALRLFRIVSAMNFAQSLLFAGVATCLLFVNESVGSIIVGYGAACFLASAMATVWAWPALVESDSTFDMVPQREFWSPLVRFAFFVWLTNLLSHCFAIIDRYMLMHFSGMSFLEAQTQVGHYHSSRIVPLLLVSFADLLGGLVMPHLSKDWEAGQRERVGKQLNLSLKLAGVGMLGFGVCVLVCSPLLFNVILQGKYNNGLAIMPWTLAGCVWYGIYALAQNYLWCAEKTRLATLPLVIGLSVNVCLNLVLLPMWGLYGAVAATGFSSLVCLTTILLLSKRHGLPLDRGTWVTVLCPLSLSAGATAAACVCAGLIIVSLVTRLVFNKGETDQIKSLVSSVLVKVRPVIQRSRFLTSRV